MQRAYSSGCQVVTHAAKTENLLERRNKQDVRRYVLQRITVCGTDPSKHKIMKKKLKNSNIEKTSLLYFQKEKESKLGMADK